MSADQCPRCKGKGGIGTFGPCEVGNIHFKNNCYLCNGARKVPTGYKAEACTACKSMGGLGTFGPCEPYNVHFKSKCTSCDGKGYLLIIVQPVYTPPPVQPFYPGQPVYTPPGQPVYTPPGQPVYTPPGQPGYYPPSQPVYTPPGQPVYTPPGQPVYTPPGQPGYYPPGQPVYTPPDQPGYYPPGQPGYYPPVQPQISWTLLPGQSYLQPPPNAVLAQQTDGVYGCVVAHTPNWGDIPGKAKDGTCWYSYGGKEYTTANYSWVILPGGSSLQKAQGHDIPPKAVSSGHQKDGAATLYSAIAITSYGQIAGKAKAGTCWYPYGSLEYTTSNFMWVCYN